MTQQEHQQWHEYILAVDEYLKEVKQWLKDQHIDGEHADIGSDPPPPPPPPPGHNP